MPASVWVTKPNGSFEKTILLTLKEPFGFVTHTLAGINQAGGIYREAEALTDPAKPITETIRSEERRVGKEGRSRWSADHLKKKKEKQRREHGVAHNRTEARGTRQRTDPGI